MTKTIPLKLTKDQSDYLERIKSRTLISYSSHIRSLIQRDMEDNAESKEDGGYKKEREL